MTKAIISKFLQNPNCNLFGAKKKILLYLSCFPLDHCNPKITTIASAIKVHRDTVIESLKQLKSAGYLTITKKWKLNHYRLNLDMFIEKNIEKNSAIRPEIRLEIRLDNRITHDSNHDNLNNKNINKTKSFKIQNYVNPQTEGQIMINKIIKPPHWLPEESWSEFKQHRVEIGKPMSRLAQKKILSKLEKLRSEGFNVVECIDESIMNGWAGVFGTKQKGFTNGKFNAGEYLYEKHGGKAFFETTTDLRTPMDAKLHLRVIDGFGDK